MHSVDVVIIGAGAAGIAAARALSGSCSVLVLEARERVGGRAWTLEGPLPLDLGCGWLHSAEENEWSDIARDLGHTVDKTFPPWSRIRNELSMSAEEQADFHRAIDAFYARVAAAAQRGDAPSSDFLEPGERWNELISAISTYANGVEADRLSIVDYDRYHDSGTNWRVREDYGATVAAYAEGLDVRLNAVVTRIDHAGRDVIVETATGAIACRAVVVTVPTEIIAREHLRFDPPLPEKVAAANGLPLGLADKVLLSVETPDDFPIEGRVFGTKDRAQTGSYHFRPLGRPVIEAYLGGECARALESEGTQAQAAFAIDELAGHFGNGVRQQLSLITATRWARDPFALGSYSAARVDHADARAVLAASVDDRIFFAGEAVSLRDFSTAHGALRSGRDAADAVRQALTKPRA